MGHGESLVQRRPLRTLKFEVFIKLRRVLTAAGQSARSRAVLQFIQMTMAPAIIEPPAENVTAVQRFKNAAAPGLLRTRVKVRLRFTTARIPHSKTMSPTIPKNTLKTILGRSGIAMGRGYRSTVSSFIEGAHQ